MLEVELKILNVDKEKVREVLEKMGAERVIEPTLMREVYLDNPFIKTDSERPYSSFRLRSAGDRTELTVKVKKDDPNYCVREEHEILVPDFDATLDLLTALGYGVFRRREKVREEWRLPTAKVEIDTYPGMNSYIEIEGHDKRAVDELLEQLEYPEELASRETASEVIRRSGLDPDNLTFKEKPPLD